MCPQSCHLRPAHLKRVVDNTELRMNDRVNCCLLQGVGAPAHQLPAAIRELRRTPGRGDERPRPGTRMCDAVVVSLGRPQAGRDLFIFRTGGLHATAPPPTGGGGGGGGEVGSLPPLPHLAKTPGLQTTQRGSQSRGLGSDSLRSKHMPWAGCRDSPWGGQVGAVAWCHAFCPKHGGDTRRYPSCKENSRRATVGGPEWPHFLQCCAGMGHRRQAGGTQLRRGPGKTRFIKRRAARMHRLSEGVRPPLCLRPVRACFIFLKG